jgi:hypothetical protein
MKSTDNVQSWLIGACITIVLNIFYTFVINFKMTMKNMIKINET